MPRVSSSLMTRPASMVLPRPTSSDSSARPRNGPSTRKRGADLIFEPLDAAVRQAKQIVGLVGNPPKRRAFAQKKSAQIVQRKCRLLKLQRRHLETHTGSGGSGARSFRE